MLICTGHLRIIMTWDHKCISPLHQGHCLSDTCMCQSDIELSFIHQYTFAFLGALKEYHRVNGALPGRIIIYRDGVGDGQLGQVVEHEIPQLLKCFSSMGENYRYTCNGFCLILYQKVHNKANCFCVNNLNLFGRKYTLFC